MGPNPNPFYFRFSPGKDLGPKLQESPTIPEIVSPQHISLSAKWISLHNMYTIPKKLNASICWLCFEAWEQKTSAFSYTWLQQQHQLSKFWNLVKSDSKMAPKTQFLAQNWHITPTKLTQRPNINELNAMNKNNKCVNSSLTLFTLPPKSYIYIYIYIYKYIYCNQSDRFFLTITSLKWRKPAT